MKIARLGLGVSAVLVLAIVVCAGPSATGPEPIVYGRDACARCHMHISQPGLGGELRDRQGRLTKYDDLGCLLLSMWREHREFPGAWAEDHQGEGFVPITHAWFVLTTPRRTPMGYGVVAFAQEAAARAYVKENGGTVGRLEEVLRDTARFQRSRSNDEVHP